MILCDRLSKIQHNIQNVFPLNKCFLALRVKNKENIEILRVLAVNTPSGTYSRNTVSASSIRVVPSESNLLQLPLVEPSVSDLCRTMGLRIVDTVHRRSKYTSRTPSNTELLKVFRYCESTASTTNCERLGYVRMPHMSAPKRRGLFLRKNTQLTCSTYK